MSYKYNTCKITMIKNGAELVPYYIFKCENCGTDIGEDEPRDNINGRTYCCNCAFLLGLIDEKHFLKQQYYSVDCDDIRAVIYDGNIYVGTGKFPWERTSRDRDCKEYRDWRMSVFERDNFTCQVCRQVGGTLNAHHIKSYKDYPKLRYCVKNGVTLCERCHKEIHRKKRGISNGRLYKN